MILKKDLLDQLLNGQPLDPIAVMRQPLIVHEATAVFKVLESFKRAPVRLAMVIDEYGSLEGIVTQTDLLEAIAGDLPDMENEGPDIVERADGSLLIEGMIPHLRWLCALPSRSYPGGRRELYIRWLALRNRRLGRHADRQDSGTAGGGDITL
jgi:CBS domain-containing protein